MSGSRFASSLFWVLGFANLVLSTLPTPLDVSVRTRNLPGQSDEDTFQAIRRRFAAAALHGRVVANSSTTLDTSWEDTPLFSFGGIHVKCTKCYIKGVVTAQATIDGSFDPGQAIDNVEAQIDQEIKNLTTTAIQTFEEYGKHLEDEFRNLDLTPDDFSFDNFTIHADFDIDIPPLPDCQLKFQLDGLELYIQLGITLEGTYTIRIFKSQSAIGISLGDNLEIGVFLTIDLILSADSGLDLESGFHIKFNDGIALDIALFSKNVSSVNFNGANFEFLPVTISIGDVVLKAVLRVGVHAGLSVGTPFPIDIPGPVDFSGGFGVEVGVFAHVAELVTHITPGTIGSGKGKDDCKLGVRQEYTLAVGAAAGATIAFLDKTWGPQPATTIPLFYTTLLDACAVQGTPAISPTLTLAGRQDLESTTTTTEVTYTGISCISTGLINCPVSLQRIVVTKSDVTLSTAVPSWEDVTWGAMSVNAVTSPVAFGTGVKELGGTSGVPTSYVPPPADTGGFVSASDSGGGGLSNNDKIAIGVGVGVGVPVLVGLIAGIWFWRRKRRQNYALGSAGVVTSVGFSTPGPQMGSYKPTGNVGVTVYQGT